MRCHDGHVHTRFAAAPPVRFGDPNRSVPVREAQTQWPGLRRHLQCLVLEFLGSLPNPQDYEIGLMRRAIETPELSSHAWRAAGRTPAWFKHLASRQLPECMADREHFGRAFAVLTQGLAAHTDEIAALVDRFWMTDPERVLRAARLLQCAGSLYPRDLGSRSGRGLGGGMTMGLAASRRRRRVAVCRVTLST